VIESSLLLRCMSPGLALFGSGNPDARCLQLGADRK
jgi:hypothetical protein